MPLSMEEMKKIDWKVVHLRSTETAVRPIPDGYNLQESPFDVTLDSHSKVEPREPWGDMLSYYRCQVDEQTYKIGDFVCINYKFEAGKLANEVGAIEADLKDFWIGQILEIKAVDASLALARVVWLYWPDDLPMSRDNHAAAKGRRDYHGDAELIVSNHMDVVNVCTFAGTLQVLHWTETDEEMKVEGPYWRQLFDIRNKQLSKLRAHCSCGDSYNPDNFVIACPSCKIWLHQNCLVAEKVLEIFQSTGPIDIVKPVTSRIMKREPVWQGGRIRIRARKPKVDDLYTGEIIQGVDGKPPQMEITDHRPKKEAVAKWLTDISCLKCKTKLE